MSTERWPEPDEKLVDEVRELEEELLSRLMEDIRSIIEVYRRQPQQIILYVAASEKKATLEKALELINEKPKNPVGDLIRWLIGQKLAEPKKAPSLAKLILDTISACAQRYKPEVLMKVAERELEFYQKAKEFLEKEFNASVEVYREGAEGIYDPKNKASSALPLRPGIYLE